ncbi:hypothetical protein QOZ84_02510 [Romboutsia sedimentorum]|uniref:DUF3278 domain-containing protein n=1 Tax=Romboutsia sedimentorum TaxID=1368474 RepID=A0ABT7E692_9FIRM|nr:hypothetical protein [Romboutsia sedimentorum]MDK2562407.1 hypothetical protein [Romboutsia sedimentorum]MDK2584643.1 hypothetical protein [Romboutsia sedimentorum]
MSNSVYGVKSKLIFEFLLFTSFFIAVLSNKFVPGINSSGMPGLVVWSIVLIGFSIYNKKFNDIIDESSKTILSKVNSIGIKFVLYSFGLVGVCFATPFTQHIDISNLDVGIVIITILLLLAILRLILFIYFDRKGIYE